MYRVILLKMNFLIGNYVHFSVFFPKFAYMWLKVEFELWLMVV